MTKYHFDESELENMQECQEDFMQDTCIIQTCVQTGNTYGELLESFTDGAEIECGLDMNPGSERRGRENVVEAWDATLRLNITRVPDPKDRIKIIKRFGTVLSVPLIYEIISPIRRGASGVRILLRRIET